MNREDVQKRITLMEQRIEQARYNGYRIDQDLVFSVKELKESLAREDILLQALDAYGGHEANNVVDYFKSPSIQPDSF